MTIRYRAHSRTVVKYTESDCYRLAQAICEKLRCPALMIRNYDNCGHVLAKIGPDRYLDIEGLHTLSDVESRWANHIVYADEWPDSATACAKFGWPYPQHSRDTWAVADRLVRWVKKLNPSVV